MGTWFQKQIHLLLIVLSIILMVGCADLAEYNRREGEIMQESHQFVQEHSTEQFKEAVAKRQLLIGMNKVEVWAIKGRPRDINKTVGAWGVHEQLIYGYGSYDNRMYLYFENDLLTSWQD